MLKEKRGGSKRCREDPLRCKTLKLEKDYILSGVQERILPDKVRRLSTCSQSLRFCMRALMVQNAFLLKLHNAFLNGALDRPTCCRVESFCRTKMETLISPVPQKGKAD